MTDAVDERPTPWVGHISLTVDDLAGAFDFYQRIGMRPIVHQDGVAILELRGGTHLILQPGPTEGGDAPFDLMVDDLAEVRARWSAEGLDASEIMTGDIHDVFVLTDPDGHRFLVYSSHVAGPV